MSKDMHNTDFDATEQEILLLLQKIQDDLHKEEEEEITFDQEAYLFSHELTEDTLPITPDIPDADLTDIPLVFPFVDEALEADSSTPTPKAPTRKQQEAQPREIEKETKVTATPAAKAPVSTPASHSKATGNRFSRMLRGLFPRKGDSAGEIVRKSVFLVSLIVFIGSLGFLGYYMILEPQRVNSQNDQYASLYNDTEGNEENNGYDYPAGMKAAFRQLYDINKDIAGWLSYTSTDDDKFLDIDLPVVHCDNNDTYLSRAFDGSKSRSGTLFFETGNTISPGVTNKVSIIYGHNMASGTMFANLNKLIGNVYRARSAPVISLSTLYDDYQYQVFAVVVCDEDAADGRHFGYLRTTFADDADFLNYVNELRARSLFDYPVDVTAQDELLILSTCTNKSQVKIKNGRLAIVARRVREGENTLMDTTRIVKNDDVIMPYAWYTAQKLTPHVFYTQADYHIPEDSVVQTTTAGLTTTTSETVAATDSTVATTARTTRAAAVVATRAPAAGTTTVPLPAQTAATPAATTGAGSTTQPTTDSTTAGTTTTVTATGTQATTTAASATVATATATETAMTYATSTHPDVNDTEGTSNE